MQKPRFLDYVLCYALYSVLFALGCITIFVVWREAIFNFLAANVEDVDTLRFIYMVSMLLLGLGLFIMVFVAEIYMRDGLRRRQLRRRFARLAVPLVLICLAGMAVRAWSLASI